jgi:two-component system OmpR family response regulator
VDSVSESFRSQDEEHVVGNVLVVNDKPSICNLIAEYFRDDLGMVVECAHSGPAGALKLARGRYDFALIDVPLGEVSGLDLAALAANGNTPVLLISGSPEFNLKLHQFGYTYLPKPFTLEALRIEATRVMDEHAANIARVKASAARMEANRLTLQAAMAASDRSLDAVRTQQMRGRWENQQRWSRGEATLHSVQPPSPVPPSPAHG